MQVYRFIFQVSCVAVRTPHVSLVVIISTETSFCLILFKTLIQTNKLWISTYGYSLVTDATDL